MDAKELKKYFIKKSREYSNNKSSQRAYMAGANEMLIEWQYQQPTDELLKDKSGRGNHLTKGN